MNKKGFTLVELLAVVVILGLIGLVTVPAVSKSIRDAKTEKTAVNVDTILNAAYDFVQKNPTRLPATTNGTSGEKICSMELICAGLLKESIATSDEVENFSGHAITVTYYDSSSNAPSMDSDTSKYFGNYLFTYQTDNSCSSYVCTAATS